MTRPRTQKADWFAHRTLHGKTLSIIEKHFGNDGYAFWFKLLETLCQSEGYSFYWSNEEEREYFLTYSNLDERAAEMILGSLARLKAIDRDLWMKHKVIWCQNLVDDMETMWKRRVCGKPIRPDLCNQESHATGINDTEISHEGIKEEVIPQQCAENPQEGVSAYIYPHVTLQNNTIPNVTTTTTVQKPLAIVVDFFENNIHPITITEFETLGQWMDEGFTPEVLKEALKEAVNSGARNMRYINGILGNWLTSGAKDIPSLEAYRRDRADRKAKGQPLDKPMPPKSSWTPEKQKEFEEQQARIELIKQGIDPEEQQNGTA